jgi:hypothetical protein
MDQTTSGNNRMTSDELVAYVMGCKRLPFCRGLRDWFMKCPRFADFIYGCKDKARKKILEARTRDELNDLMSELKLAFLLLTDDRFEVDYETFGAGKEAAPDFTVTFGDETVFHVEVKRIREAELTVRFERLIGEIEKKVREVPSRLVFAIEPGIRRLNLRLLNRLESSMEAIADHVKNTVRREEDNLPVGKQCEFAIPGFEQELTFYLSRPSYKQAAGPTVHDGFKPVPYTQREYRKLGDIICDSLRQMVPDAINILAVFCSSFTHEELDVLKAVGSIKELLARGPEDFFTRKGFSGKEDFLHQARKLSGVLFRDSYVPMIPAAARNFLWCNQSADHPIPDAVKDHLFKMDG